MQIEHAHSMIDRGHLALGRFPSASVCSAAFPNDPALGGSSGEDGDDPGRRAAAALDLQRQGDQGGPGGREAIELRAVLVLSKARLQLWAVSKVGASFSDPVGSATLERFAHGLQTERIPWEDSAENNRVTEPEGTAMRPYGS